MSLHGKMAREREGVRKRDRDREKRVRESERGVKRERKRVSGAETKKV